MNCPDKCRDRTTPRLGVVAAPGWTAIACAATCGSAIVTLLVPAAIARTVNAIAAGDSVAGPMTWLAAVFLAAGFMAALGVLAAGVHGATLTRNLRKRLAGGVISLGARARSQFPEGDLTTRLTIDATTPSVILPTLLTVGGSAVTSVGAVSALWLIDWRLAATFLAALPVILFLVGRFVANAGSLTGRYRELQAETASRLVGATAGIRTIQVSGTLEREIARVIAPLPELRAVGRKLWHQQRRVSWQAGLLVALIEILVLAVAGLRLAGEHLQPGGFLAAAAYVAIAIGGFDSLDSLMDIVRARVGAARVREVLATTPPPMPAKQQLLPTGRGEIRFDNVTVHYEGRTTLDAITLIVPPCASVAIVGPSGSGKSTLVALVGRIFDPQMGRVLLDGVPVTELGPDVLHAAVAYAFERPARLGKTVTEMINLGTDDGSLERATVAARSARADSFIRRLPQGYATPLNQAPFSGGELQRIGIAQALARSARVLILDDATNSLDTFTEHEVLAALDATSIGRTTLTVTHRVSGAVRADLVIWLDKGRLRGFAPHQQLWSDPDYREMLAPEFPGQEATP